ncbi:uncharacterized protein VTP21DRAFT_2360 [Calcarisporiella thermophila]|uniref:uncharacterized protein n=1 Tax=Calcarisporiella thermophila TaxID=911321 RepID=UPI003744519B
MHSSTPNAKQKPRMCRLDGQCHIQHSDENSTGVCGESMEIEAGHLTDSPIQPPPAEPLTQTCVTSFLRPTQTQKLKLRRSLLPSQSPTPPPMPPGLEGLVGLAQAGPVRPGRGAQPWRRPRTEDEPLAPR